MLKKIIFLFSIFAIAALVLSTSTVLAKNDNNAVNDWVAPEQNGTYDVPGHPGLKVRVFVHHAKPDKPGPCPSSILKCDLTDPISDEIVKGAGWIIPAGTWKYRVNPNVPSTIGANLGTIVNNSFAAWMNTTDLSNSGVRLQPDGTTNINRASLDGQNIIAWGRTSGSALGVTYIWYKNGVAKELDTIMNEKSSWSWGGGGTTCAYTNVYDAQDILTHELGHWFGLDDEYDLKYQNNTMYGYGSTWEVKKDTLTAGDIAGINALY